MGDHRSDSLSLSHVHVFSIYRPQCQPTKLGNLANAYTSLCESGMLASTFLISCAPKPVAVRLCFGLVKSGPTGPCSSEMGALVEGRLSRVCVAAIVNVCRRGQGEAIEGFLLCRSICRRKEEGGNQSTIDQREREKSIEREHTESVHSALYEG